jgi:hypothetical protein
MTTSVSCLSCAYEWHSEAMADGLRLLGSCPRCGGELSFASPAPEAITVDVDMQRAEALGSRPASMVLGMPRGW